MYYNLNNYIRFVNKLIYVLIFCKSNNNFDTHKKYCCYFKKYCIFGKI